MTWDATFGATFSAGGSTHARPLTSIAASTSAYLAGLRDFGWDGDDRAVLFARAAAAALATATLMTTQIDGLCDHTPNYYGDGNWPQELADRHQLSVETVDDSMGSQPRLRPRSGR